MSNGATKQNLDVISPDGHIEEGFQITNGQATNTQFYYTSEPTAPIFREEWDHSMVNGSVTAIRVRESYEAPGYDADSIGTFVLSEHVTVRNYTEINHVEGWDIPHFMNHSVSNDHVTNTVVFDAFNEDRVQHFNTQGDLII
jgi:hypothetical protein